MADSEAVARGIRPRPGTRYTALVPNLRGLARAVGAGLREVSVFGAASETFSRRNINQVDRRVVRDASAALIQRGRGRAGIRVRAYLSTAFGCPYEGRRCGRARGRTDG